MTRISAAEHLVIEMDFANWQLLQLDEEGNRTLVMDAQLNQPLRYSTAFATSRHLPSGGVLPVEYIRQVVVGWSYEDEAWHLGLLLAPDLAGVRGSRWCEIARWPDPDRDLFNDFARAAGESLAEKLSKPLNCVSPQADKTAKETLLPDLPLNLGVWTLDRMGDNTLALMRKRRWVFGQFTRLIWYVAWATIYILLSVSTLNSDLALPNAGAMLPSPEILPYLGLATAAILVLMALYLLYQILTSTNRILVDGERHRVVGLRGSSQRWEKTGNNLCDVYVTQIVKDKRNKRTVFHGELNLRQTNGDFYRILEQPDKTEETLGTDDQMRTDETAVAEEAVLALTPANHLSNLQAAGLHIAKTLGGLPCWYDQRVR
jgi:hypothetical protein